MVYAFKNAEPVQELSIAARGFHYGDGFFTTARLCNNHWQLQVRHLQRLQHAAQRLFMEVDLQYIDQAILKLKQQLGILNGTLKIVISRAEGQRGYAFDRASLADVYVLFYPQVAFQQTDVQHTPTVQFIQSGLLEQRLGLCMPQLRGLKTLNRLEQVLLRHEADHRQWSEALVGDLHGYIVEGVSSNCFLRINNQWIAPELRYNGVQGVMQDEILARMQQQQIACRREYVKIEDLQQLQSLFFCNALSAMKIVTHFQQQTLETAACLQLFQDLKLDQL
ncbi:aminodeoxychorismate lyase [Acinetobacter larvae]|uniref:Aminodeoxychorismate lyase n=1 Tax=Acinetobacter larvae TaxID=1789224 RepID=A0A1B2LXK9_9GAMM|nr:aminodeoxychorismate lyase [Acinetobacter larvae]AOA57688.1 aminodeoxychorismate lyase [Acinetobacter larvae]